MAKLLNRQAGTATIASGGSTSGAVTVSGYVAARSLLLYTAQGGGANPAGGLILGLKASSTSLTFERNSTEASVLSIKWELLQFASEDVRVQDITWTVSGSTAVTSVNLSKSFIVSSGYDNTGTIHSGDENAQFEFLSPTSVKHAIQTGAQNVDNGMFQVVEYQGCYAQSFTTVLAAAGTTWNQAISPVKPERSMLFASMQYGGNDTILAFNDVSRLKLTNTDNVQGNRATAAAFVQTITCFICEFDDWKVQRGSATIAAAASTTNVTITAVDRAVSISKTNAAYGQASGFGAGTTTSDDFNQSRATTALTTNTNLQLVRASTTNALDIDWEVAEHFDEMVGNPLFFGASF